MNKTYIFMNVAVEREFPYSQSKILKKQEKGLFFIKK